MLTIILLCLGFVLGIVLMALGYRNDYGEGICFVIGLFLFASALLLGIGLSADQYGETRSLPLRIAALQRTIAEQQALLSDDGELVSGLEGLEVKKQLFENIKERNDLIARAEYIQISIWWFIKLPPNWREIAELES